MKFLSRNYANCLLGFRAWGTVSLCSVSLVKYPCLCPAHRPLEQGYGSSSKVALGSKVPQCTCRLCDLGVLNSLFSNK